MSSPDALIVGGGLLGLSVALALRARGLGVTVVDRGSAGGESSTAGAGLLMAQAALLADQIPRQLSFKHTVQIWIAWQQRGGGTHDAVSIHGLLVLIAEPRVGLRPGRVEPRALKRRPKPFPLLTDPRAAAKEEIRQHGHPKKQR